MKFDSRSALLTAMLSVVPAASVLAQNSNPANSGGGGAPIATPTYETNAASNPALTTGVPPKGVTGIPADENPSVRGATGETVVKGDRSTITGDRRATVQQKTGGGEEGGGN